MNFITQFHLRSKRNIKKTAGYRALLRGMIPFIVLFAISCAGSQKIGTSIHTTGAGSLQEAYKPAEHIVFIGMDGWGGAYTLKADMPAVKRMITGGASSMDMRSVMPSISWPNWSTLFSGTAPEHRNGETGNDVSEFMDYPTVFTLLKNSRQRNCFFFEWNTLDYICREEETQKIKIKSDTESAQEIASYIIKNKPVFTAVAFDEPDSTGHKNHWGSKAYYEKLSELDNLIAIIEQAVKDAGIYDSTVFVLSADHGGNYWGHGRNNKKQRQIPIIFYGRGIKRGFTIPSPLSICDIAPTMAFILGLEIPPEWEGRPITGIFNR